MSHWCQGTALYGFTHGAVVPIHTAASNKLMLSLIDFALISAARPFMQDHLTGLPNRWAIDALLSKGFAPSQNGWTIFKIDIDRLHQINDTYGAAVGDVAIKHTANVLRQNLRSVDVVARVGGDEFAIISPEVDTENSVVRLAHRILTDLNQPVTLLSKRLHLGASIGVSIGKVSDDTPAATMSQARTALQFAKSKGRGSVVLYSDDMHRRIDQFSQLSEEIAEGIEKGQFVAYYQPQFSTSDLSLTGAEVLIRWHHPEKGVLTPGDFLDVARDLNLADTLDNVAMAQVEANYRQWQNLDAVPPAISMNTSLSRLRDTDYLERLKHCTLPTGVLRLELLESSFMDELDDIALNGLRVLRENHIDLEIDDFGTGHSSILGLIKLQPSCVKIDRKLVPRDGAASEEMEVLCAAVSIAKCLGATVTLEGIEHKAQIEIGRRVGADKLQGYGLGLPMAPTDFTNFLCATSRRSGVQA